MNNSNQSIKKLIGSLKCGIVYEDFDVPSNAIYFQNKPIIHEYNFITAGIKETNNSFLINCITCGIYYCRLCGKALENKVTNRECY